MSSQLTPERYTAMDILFANTPKKEEKKKDEIVMPGLEPKLEISQISFTSEFIPLEDAFGDQIPAKVPLSEVIWNDHQASTCRITSSVELDSQTAEPGPSINYDMLNKMIINVPRRMPDTYVKAFQILALTRVRYLAAYQVFMEEKRNTTDSFATGKILFDKKLHIHRNPTLYSKSVAAENEAALRKIFTECAKLKEQFEEYRRNLMRSIYELIRVKGLAMPYIVRLRAAYLEVQRQCQEQKERERLEKVRLENEKNEKKRLAREKTRRENAQKVALKEDAATKARKALEAEAWAAYLAKSKRQREEGEADHSRGAKRVNLGNGY
ncbi:hypothetical protein MauCBS54593_006396 [Microsporum audouinii]